MNVHGKHYRTIWLRAGDERVVEIIDQRALPHRFVIEQIDSVEKMAAAILEMHVRGAGLIGASAGYGMYLAALAIFSKAHKRNSDTRLAEAAMLLKCTRPTAVNLAWAVDRQLAAIARGSTAREKISIARETAALIADEDADACRAIGEHGLPLLRTISKRKPGKPMSKVVSAPAIPATMNPSRRSPLLAVTCKPRTAPTPATAN